MVYKKKVYRAVRGDDLDKAIAKILHETGFYERVDVKRIQAGLYTFGDKRISASLKNGRVILRTGGGYMPLEEFISHYGV